MTQLKKTIGPLLLVFILCVAPLAADSWRTTYAKAEKAVKKKAWSKAIDYIRRALEDKDTPEYNAKGIGMRFINYHPYYYLGMAHYNLGDYSRAAAALKKAAGYSVAKKAGFQDELTKMLDACNKKLKPPEVKPVTPSESHNATLIKQLMASGEKLMNEGNPAAAKREFVGAKALITKTGELKSLLPRIDRDLNSIETSGKIEQLMQQADSAFNEKRYKESAQQLKQVLELDAGHAGAKRFLGQVNRELNRPPEPKTKQVKPAELTISPPKETLPVPKKKDKGTIQQLMEEGKQLYLTDHFSEAGTKFASILELEPNHRDARQWVTKASYASGVHNLNEGIGNYFKGKRSKCERHLKEAAAVLENPDTPKYRDKLVIALQFLAATFIERHYLNMESNDQLLKKAGEYASRIYALKPDFQLDKTYFSPKITAVFDQAKKNNH